jgi:hypothetical protein
VQMSAPSPTAAQVWLVFHLSPTPGAQAHAAGSHVVVLAVPHPSPNLGVEGGAAPGQWVRR